MYQEQKKKREEKKKAKVSETKEIRLGPFMDDHDLNVMIGRGRNFLDDGNKVRLVVKFIGRQITHPEFGEKILKKAIEALSHLSKIDREPHFEGKQLVTILTPYKKKAAHDSQTEQQENKPI